VDLITEVERYLAAVDVFRAEDCQPYWLPEGGAWPRRRNTRRRARDPLAGMARKTG